MPTSKRNKKLSTNKHSRLIIESSSSSSLEKKHNKKKSNNTIKSKNNNTTRKNKLLIIESSSSSPMVLDKKEKIDTFFHSKLEENNKTDLKISQGFTQQMSENAKSTSRLNEQFFDLMDKLADIMLKNGEPFRARAYQKAQETILAYPGDILSPSDLKGKPNIGVTIMEKFNEYMETGTLKILEREKSNPVNILSEVYGIGPKKAKELADNGITSIAELRENQHLLNDIQKVGLHYYEDILKRIPRTEIENFKDYFKRAIPKDSQAKMEIVGSYRRGTQSSGDIDVIITSTSPQVFTKFIDNLLKEKIILHLLSRGPTKSLVVAKIPTSNFARRVDFLYTNPEEFPFAILYFTGSKIFNTVMRHVALEKGYTMNEHGIYKMNAKKKGEKVNHTFNSEKDIFDFLNLEYKSPVERTDGTAIVVKSSTKKKLLIVDDSTNSETEEYVLSTKSSINDKPKTMMIHEDNEYKNIAKNFKENGITILNELNEKQLSQLLREANKAYYNEDPYFTDNQYDIIKEYIEAKYPSNNVIREVGAPTDGKRNKVTLPYTMGSMDKIKPDTTALANWTAKYKGPYVLSCKLDGVSGLYTTDGSSPKLYTRGDGRVGQDISNLIPFLRLPKTRDVVIRGEFIIPKGVFETKYKNKFANPRNMVAGIINHKTINDAIKDVHFVAYELIKPVNKPSKQLEYLSTMDVEVVMNKFENTLSNELLSQTLIDWRQNYAYEIDGVIASDDAIYTRKPGNPEHSFAFKMVLTDQVAEAKVVDVLWTPSKDGYLKPRVQIEPIHLGGVQITYATGFNGAFINENKIGVGSVVQIIRSGDVIPHISKVIIHAEQAKMPSVPFKWNNTHVDVMLEDIHTDETVKEKNITGFFRGIGVEGLSSGNIKRIIEAGYDSVPDILKMEIPDFLEVHGIKDKTATKLYDGIRTKIEAASLTSIMSASNIFGRGFSEKKIKVIMDAYPNVLLSKESDSHKIAKILLIKGMATKSAEAFVERISEFIKFIKETGLVKKLSLSDKINKKLDQTHPLFGKYIVMTGFRDNELLNELKELGANIGSSVSSKTFVVLVKDKDEDTGKASQARKLEVILMTPEEFRNKYIKK